jgi:hypothetical protein
MAAAPDFKDRCGNWVKTFNFNGKHCYTLSGRRWYNMMSRTNPLGAYQQDKSSYVGVTSEFISFQSFVDWSLAQHGYDESKWHLDKDLLIKGNKSYSEYTCLFLPQELNSFISFPKANRGWLPLGVYWKERIHRFVANSKCPLTGIYKHLGVFNSKESAFLAYKSFKEGNAKVLATKWRDKIDPRAYEALMSYQVEITD